MRARSLGILGIIAGPVLLGSLTACSSGESAPKKTDSIASAAFDWDLSYAKCMRDQGIDYKDPVVGQGPQQTHTDDTDALLAADKTCEEKTTKQRGEKPRTEAEKKQRAEWADSYSKAADCLRKKGYEVKDIDGGGWGSDDDISDADMQACQPDAQHVGGTR